MNTNNNMINLNFNLNVSNESPELKKTAKGESFDPQKLVIQKNLKQFNIEKVKMQAVFLNE